jgi:RNA methyltransferase, TrmH family
MISKNQVKFIRSLHLRKERETHRQFLAEGSKVVLETAAGPYEVYAVYALPEWIAEHGPFLEAHRIPFEPAELSELERITALATPSPAMAVVKMKKEAAPPAVPANGLTLVLDGIRDPGNLGTIIRIADWFGIGQIVCSPDTVELYNPKVIQSTMGSFCRVDVIYAPLFEFLSSPGLPVKVYGTFAGAGNIYQQELSGSGLIVIGSESHGISAALEKFITDKISIPSFAFEKDGGEHAESLNAAIAAAIVCAEFRRRVRG